MKYAFVSCWTCHGLFISHFLHLHPTFTSVYSLPSRRPPASRPLLALVFLSVWVCFCLPCLGARAASLPPTSVLPWAADRREVAFDDPARIPAGFFFVSVILWGLFCCVSFFFLVSCVPVCLLVRLNSLPGLLSRISWKRYGDAEFSAGPRHASQTSEATIDSFEASPAVCVCLCACLCACVCAGGVLYFDLLLSLVSRWFSCNAEAANVQAAARSRITSADVTIIHQLDSSIQTNCWFTVKSSPSSHSSCLLGRIQSGAGDSLRFFFHNCNNHKSNRNHSQTWMRFQHFRNCSS